MMRLLFIGLLFCCNMAQAVEFNEPEVVPEGLVRANRRVLRFSGSAEPGAQLRVKEGKIKIMFPSGQSKIAALPQKNKNQFPLVAHDSGEFSFDLYLPTASVVIPVEVYRNGGWVTYNLNVKVPAEGAAYDFQAIEETIGQGKADPDDDGSKPVEENVDPLYKDKTGNARDEVITGVFDAWLGLGLNYFMNGVQTPTDGNLNGSFSGLNVPLFDVGTNVYLHQNWRLDLSVELASLAYPANTDLILPASNGSWFLIGAGASYRPESWVGEWGRWGADMGLYYNQIPYLKLRDVGNANHTIANDSVKSLYAGVSLDTKSENWDSSFFARLSYPAMANSTFSMSGLGYGLHLEAGSYYKMYHGLHFGLFGDFMWNKLSTKYSMGAVDYDTKYDLKMFNVSFRLKTSF